MGAISTTGRLVFRDYVTDGVPASGLQKTVKADIRSWVDIVDASVVGSSTGALPISGGTMTGPLILSGNPVVALGAAPKQYADLKVARTGDTMTGALAISDATASTSPTTGAVTIVGGLGVGGQVNAAGLKMSVLDFTLNRVLDVTKYGLIGNIGNTNFYYNNIDVAFDQTAGTQPQNIIAGLNVHMESGGGVESSTKTALQVVMSHSSASTPSPAGDYIAANLRCTSDKDYGGTNTGAGAQGTCFAAGLSAILSGTATNYLEVCGAEIDIGIQDSATSRYRFGFSVASVGEKHGVEWDAAYEIGASNAGGIGWNVGFLIAGFHGTPAIQSTGTVMTFSDAATVDTVFDFSNVTATSYLIRGPSNNFTVNGSGNVIIAASSAVNLTLSGNSTPQILFAPTSGATKTGQIQQQGNALLFNDSGVASRMSLDIATGNLSLLTGRLVIAGATTATSQIRLAVGGPPTTPVDGDIWFESNTNTGLKVRVNGVTKTVTLA